MKHHQSPLCLYVQKATYVGNEQSPERDQVVLRFGDFKSELTAVSSCADQWARLPDLPDEVIGLEKKFRYYSTQV